MKLSECKNNTTVTVKEILQNGDMDKLCEFGVSIDTKVKILAKAPFKGPVFIEANTIRVAIRLKQASNIIVEEYEEY